MASLLCFAVALAAFIAFFVGRKCWFGGNETNVGSDVTKLVISADSRPRRRQSMERVVRDAVLN
jgi:hypothetical protein